MEAVSPSECQGKVILLEDKIFLLCLPHFSEMKIRYSKNAQRTNCYSMNKSVSFRDIYVDIGCKNVPVIAFNSGILAMIKCVVSNTF